MKLVSECISFLKEIRRTVKYRHRLATPKNQYEKKIAKAYKRVTGYTMDFENPSTFTQKQQWLKLYDVYPDKTVRSDKYAVRDIIKEELGEEYLIPLIDIDGVEFFDDANKIDFDKLPNQFVMKCNHASGYNFVVQDKSKLSNKDIKKMKKKLNKWLNMNYAFANGFEILYDGIKPYIIIEKYMGDSEQLCDYKFLCFSGTPKYVWIDRGRYSKHVRGFYNMEFEELEFTFNTFPKITEQQKPENFELMKKIAKKLCGNYPFVRVDLYNINGHIFFGELTYSSCSGYTLPNPVEYDRILADEIIIDKSKRDKITQYRV